MYNSLELHFNSCFSIYYLMELIKTLSFRECTNHPVENFFSNFLALKCSSLNCVLLKPIEIDKQTIKYKGKS